LTPYLTGEKIGQPHDALFFRRADRNFWSIRQGNYKWVYNTIKNKKLVAQEPEGGGLYDIQNDISESVDLSKTLRTKRDEISKLYQELTKDLPKPLSEYMSKEGKD
jgi:hypothetical protein